MFYVTSSLTYHMQIWNRVLDDKALINALEVEKDGGGGLEWYKNFLWDNGNAEWVLWTTLLKELTKLAAPTERQVDLGLFVHQIGQYLINSATHTHKQPFNGPLSGTTQVSQYQKSNTNLDFTEARDSE